MDSREILARLYAAAVRAVDPVCAVKQTLFANKSTISLASGVSCSPARVLVLGLGKAAPAMAQAVEEILQDNPLSGAIVSPYLPARSLHHILYYRGDHPLPGSNSETAGRELLRQAGTADERTLTLVLVSGGGSAAAAVPAAGITLADKRATTDLLLRSGADIRDINTVRRHLSAIKGGQLAAAIPAGPVWTLILSDVIGDDLSAVASGPTISDPTTFADAWNVLTRYALEDKVPPAVKERLQAGLRGEFIESPRILDSQRFQNVLVGSNRQAVAAAAAEARHLGLPVEVLPEPLLGEAREVGRRLAERVKGMNPVCFIAGGETTVTVAGTGKGGRNQELALGFLERCGADDVLLAASTDGIDGPTDAAGGFADERVRQQAEELGLNLGEALRNNDAYGYLERSGGLFCTGPTGTNVCDVAMILHRVRV